ncbi:MAG: hypothetical protein QXF82_08460 [Nitrososphaeria archaeon]
MKIALTLSDYHKCMLFALRMWYYGKKSTLDWRRAGRRDIGDYLSDHAQGKLAEISFARFLKERYNIEGEIDLEVRPGIQVVNESDIRMIAMKGGRRRPKIKIDVKATTPKSKYFLVDAWEFENRRYDVYILVLVDLPKDHIIRFLASSLELPDDLKRYVKPLQLIDSDILGFAYRNDIEIKGKLYKAGESLVDPKNPKRKLVQLKSNNYGLPISELRQKDAEWDELVKKL